LLVTPSAENVGAGCHSAAMTYYLDDQDYNLDYDDYDDEPPPAALPLTAAQRGALARTVDAGLREHGCDGTLRAAQAWAEAVGHDWPALRRGLEDHGG
jgi:hypothetical protein